MKTRQIKKKGSYLEKQEADPYSCSNFQKSMMKVGLTTDELVRRLKDKADAIPDEVEAYKAEKGMFDSLAPYVAKKTGTASHEASSTPQVFIVDFTNLYATPQQKEKIINATCSSIE